MTGGQGYPHLIPYVQSLTPEIRHLSSTYARTFAQPYCTVQCNSISLNIIQNESSNTVRAHSAKHATLASATSQLSQRFNEFFL